MSNFTITISAPELSKAIKALAQAPGHKEGLAEPATSTVQVKESYPRAPVAIHPPTGVPTTAAPDTSTAPTREPTHLQEVVPTSASAYTMEQLAVAATQLVDAGRREELVQLLGQFGVQALTVLPKEQYGAFATSLRQMGAKI